MSEIKRRVHFLPCIDPRTRASFRRWLKQNVKQNKSIWIRVYKKTANAELLKYEDVVEECLCFGWIDSLPRKKDLRSYELLISPRRPRSVWSRLNKKRIIKLKRENRMTKFGLEKIKQAKSNGSWARTYPAWTGRAKAWVATNKWTARFNASLPSMRRT